MHKMIKYGSEFDSHTDPWAGCPATATSSAGTGSEREIHGKITPMQT